MAQLADRLSVDGYGSLPLDGAWRPWQLPLGTELNSYGSLPLGSELDCLGSLPLGMTLDGLEGSPFSSGLDCKWRAARVAADG